MRNDPPGRRLADGLAEASARAAAQGIPWKGLRIIVGDEPGNVVGFTGASLSQLYRKLTCQADAIAVGHTTLWVHRLSAHETAVYTDYDLVIDTVLKDNQRHSIRSTPDIVVTRPGGSLSLPGGPVTSEFQGFPELQPGTSYLQFLLYIPASSGYQPLDSFSTLVAAGGDWEIARKPSAVRGFARGTLEASIGNWLTSCK